MEERYPAEWRRGTAPSNPWLAWPSWQEWRNWLEEIPWPWEGRAASPRSWPSVDIYQTDNEIVLRADLPGVDPKNVDIHVSDHSVTLKGEVQQSEEFKQENAYRVERRYGSFLRTIPLPSQVDPDRATAQFRQGILEVHLPRTGTDRGRRIPINPVQ